MIRGLLFNRLLPAALIAVPLALGLPAKAGGAFILGALTGLAVVLPVALVLRLIDIRTFWGWPLWLLGLALRIVWGSRRRG